MKNISLGDVLLYKSKEYIFLGIADDVVYAAKILNHQETELLNRRFELNSKKDHKRQTIDTPLFAFVILESEDFINRAAHYGSPSLSEEETYQFDIIGKSVDEDDRKNLIDAILSPSECVPLGLRRLIKTYIEEGNNSDTDNKTTNSN